MPDYDFILKFALPDPESDAGNYVADLEAAGCNDAVMGIGKKGRIALDFTRSAPSAREAVISAVKDVQRVIPHARLVEAEPDYVGLTELAEIFEFSRQNMRKIATSDSTFPMAVHEGKVGLFHLVEVLDWVEKTKRARVRQDLDGEMLMEVARANREINLATQINRLPNKKLLRDVQQACEA